MIAIVRLPNSTAELTHGNIVATLKSCTRKSNRSGVYYYRQLHLDILFDLNDLDNLKLEENDSLCGDQRKYISTRNMAHIRQRRNGNQR